MIGWLLIIAGFFVLTIGGYFSAGDLIVNAGGWVILLVGVVFASRSLSRRFAVGESESAREN